MWLFAYAMFLAFKLTEFGLGLGLAFGLRLGLKHKHAKKHIRQESRFERTKYSFQVLTKRRKGQIWPP